MNIFGKAPAYQSIGCTEYESLMQAEEQHALIDVRSPGEFNSGHIPGAVNIPLDELSIRVNEIPQDRNVILVCASGNRSGIAADALIRGGYHAKRVYNLTGGTMGWMMQGLPLE
ncbi:MAG: rhodanese-like domain-containing protein [Anaerolineales bacterium]